MSKTPDPIDILVGSNIREMRRSKRMTQQELGAKLGLSFQQIQKYERGHNRVGSSTLAKLAAIFSVSVDRFFDAAQSSGPVVSRLPEGAKLPEAISLAEAIRVLQALARMPDPEMQRTLANLTEMMADQLTSTENEKH